MEMEFVAKWPKRMGDLGDQPTGVINKLYLSLGVRGKSYQQQYSVNHQFQYGSSWERCGTLQKAKIHQMQSGQYWEIGMSIRPVLSYEGEDTFQFAPALMCLNVQKLQVLYYTGHYLPFVIIDDQELNRAQFLEFANNEGFESLTDFISYYDTDFIGQVVHWTDKSY